MPVVIKRFIPYETTTHLGKGATQLIAPIVRSPTDIRLATAAAAAARSRYSFPLYRIWISSDK